MSGHVVPAGDTAHGALTVDVTPERAGWTYSGVKVVELGPGSSVTLDTGPDEALVLPLSGAVDVTVAAGSFSLTGRPDVFSALTDHLYLPRGTTAELTSAGGGRFAIPTARATRTLGVSYRPASDVTVELRGAGAASRECRNYALGNALETDHLLVVEVVTPGGNWSSYPPHKHDEHSDVERALEEIYLFEIRPGPDGPGVGYHRQYGTEGRPMDVLAEVRTGDVVLVPHGYHGPCMAAPGYDMYYLNVMAGPADDGAWLMTDDPAHHWVRGTWAGAAVDPRLPMSRREQS